MDKISLDLSQAEVQQLLELMDAAVRAHGLNAAGAAVSFVQKINAAKEALEVKNTKRSR